MWEFTGVVLYHESTGFLGRSHIARAADEVCSMDLSRGDVETEIMEVFDDNAAHVEEAMTLAEKMITDEGMGSVVVYDTTRDNQGELARFVEDGNGGSRRLW